MQSQNEYETKVLFLSYPVLAADLEKTKKEKLLDDGSDVEINELSIAMVYNLELMLMIVVDYIHHMNQATLPKFRQSTSEDSQERQYSTPTKRMKEGRSSGSPLAIAFPVTHYLYQFIEKIEVLFEFNLHQSVNSATSMHADSTERQQPQPELLQRKSSPTSAISSLFFNRSSLYLKGINFQKIDEITMMWINTCFGLTDCLLEAPSAVKFPHNDQKTSSLHSPEMKLSHAIPKSQNDYFNYQFLQCTVHSLEVTQSLLFC